MEGQDVYDIDQFCERHRISKSTYFNLQKSRSRAAHNEGRKSRPYY